MVIRHLIYQNFGNSAAEFSYQKRSSYVWILARQGIALINVHIQITDVLRITTNISCNSEGCDEHATCVCNIIHYIYKKFQSPCDVNII